MKKNEIYICISLNNENKIITESISAASAKEAASSFFDKVKIKPEKILGPYLKKKVNSPNNVLLQFNGSHKQAIYDGWVVNAMPINDPEDHALLLFIRREDGTIKQKPSGKIIVPICDLRFT